MWFESLMGFCEEHPDQVRSHLQVDGETLTSLVNGKSYQCGTLTTPSLFELREHVVALDRHPGKLCVSEVIGDVQKFHCESENAGAMFQVASQFNLLEMVSPSITPERGVAIYQNDFTQGPACAIACGAGTIYRNYFAEIEGRVGQPADYQIDCLYDLGLELGNHNNKLWEMRNGYALATQRGLSAISLLVSKLNESEVDTLRGLLRIGVQKSTEVTISDTPQLVTQAFCSALPVAYSSHSSDDWEVFARLILEAAYEATLCTAILNAEQTGNNKLYLTLLGGGAFGNRTEWIIDAIHRALRIHANAKLEVFIVCYSGSDPSVQKIIASYQHSIS